MVVKSVCENFLFVIVSFVFHVFRHIASESLHSIERTPIKAVQKVLPDFVEGSVTIPARPRPVPAEILRQVEEV